MARASRAARALWRVGATILALAFLTALPVALVGQDIGIALDTEALVAQLRSTGWAGAAGVMLIVSDIALPVPATAAMAALGILYGPVVGGILSAFGSVLAGSLGYGLCRMIGPQLAARVAGAEGIAEARRLYERWGFGLVAVSRWVPVLPETVAFLCGLIRVPFPQFLAALTCGAIPLGFLFATAGHYGQSTPILIMVLCALAPLVLIAVIRWLTRAR